MQNSNNSPESALRSALKKIFNFTHSVLKKIKPLLILLLDKVSWILGKIIKNGIAIAALLISALTAFFSFLQPPEIVINAGTYIAISKIYNKTEMLEYILRIPISFSNNGARSGLLERIGLVIKDPQNEHYAYFLKSVSDEVVRQSQDGGLSWEASSVASAIIIPSRNPITKNVRFEIPREFNLEVSVNKTYDFFVLAWDSESMRPTQGKHFRFTFSQDIIRNLEQEMQSQKKALEKLDAAKRLNKAEKPLPIPNKISGFTGAEDGKYGPMTGKIDRYTYKILTERWLPDKS